MICSSLKLLVMSTWRGLPLGPVMVSSILVMSNNAGSSVSSTSMGGSTSKVSSTGNVISVLYFILSFLFVGVDALQS